MASTNPPRGNRTILLLIVGFPLSMILGATWLWYFGERGSLDVVGMLGTANRGSLIQPPRQLDEQNLIAASGTATKYADMEPRWTMVVPVAGSHCAAACEKSLYLTRQIHVAMGKDFNRLRRLAVGEFGVADIALTVDILSDGRPAPPSSDFAAFLATEHKGLEALKTTAIGYNALFSEYSTDSSTWYLVDPGGWIMMSYNSQVSYKDVMTDLKYLLKNSSV